MPLNQINLFDVIESDLKRFSFIKIIVHILTGKAIVIQMEEVIFDRFDNCQLLP